MIQSVAFYSLLSLPICVWGLMVLPNAGAESSSQISSAIIKTIVAMSPIVGGDLSIFGEVTPVLLAGSIIALAPNASNRNYYALILCLLSYALFVHLSVYFTAGFGSVVLSQNWGDTSSAQKVILNLISNVRVMTIVIAASILGFVVKGASQQQGT